MYTLEMKQEKVEVIQRKDREYCLTANGFLICRCGKCKPEDYKLPEDFYRVDLGSKYNPVNHDGFIQ